MENLAQALRLGSAEQVGISGAGGKTSALFRLARELGSGAILAASTHMGHWQLKDAGEHHVALSTADVDSALTTYMGGSILFTGPLDEHGRRTHGLSEEILFHLHRRAHTLGLPLLIEADGARRLPLKAPAEHEPALPPFIDAAIVTAGLSGVSLPLSEESVYGAQRFAEISGLKLGAAITIDAIARVLSDKRGGLKGIPENSRRISLLNQADDLQVRHEAQTLAVRLLEVFDTAAVTSLGVSEAQIGAPQIEAVYERCAAIVLAAGGARRMGNQKMLLPWKGESVVRAVIKAAIAGGIHKVIVVTGSEADLVRAALRDFEIEFVYNPDWEQGQGTSVAAGMGKVPAAFGSALFLLGDQPLITSDLIRAIYERHAHTHASAVAPFVGGQRGNPVLFDQSLFSHLQGLSGEAGGRQLLGNLMVEKVDWEDDSILFDLDTPKDYRRLQERIK